jgi:hypothetical protein
MRLRLKRACRRARRLIPLLHYAALDPIERAGIEAHLAACPGCSREWSETRRLLGRIEEAAAFPRQGEVDWERFARDTVARARAAAAAPAGRRPPSPFPVLPALARWGAVLAAAMLIAFAALSLLRRPSPIDEGGFPRAQDESASRESMRRSAEFIEGRLARRGAARYLEDSRALLVGLVQSKARCRKEHGDLDVTLEKERSRQLLRRKNLYEGDLTGLEDQRLAALVGQLESILIQVSSLNDCAAARQIHELGDQIERRQILLRIDLVTREMKGRARDVV